ncbi:TIGR02588 family protein [Prochlorothrix hollandica]|uniref:TIGR02588 family protein n=1 Tax=Prochlorothrix hollandica TaxID=1223 RepID=UPI0033404F41
MDSSPVPPTLQSPVSPARSPLRWFTFILATGILITLVGLIIYAGLVTQNQPPILKAELTEPFRVVDGAFYVPFTVTNVGGESAEAIQIMAELRIEGDEPETGEQQVDSLSSSETIKGSFVFSHDPQDGDLSLRVASYRSPQALQDAAP